MSRTYDAGCRRTTILLLTALAVFYRSPAEAQTPANDYPGQAPPTSRQIGAWIAELSDSSYRVRDQATRHLMKAGAPVVEPLLSSVDRDDPEAFIRARRILTRIACADEAALESLEQLSKSGGPAVQQAASAFLNLPVVRKARSRRVCRKIAGLLKESADDLKDGKHKTAQKKAVRAQAMAKQYAGFQGAHLTDLVAAAVQSEDVQTVRALAVVIGQLPAEPITESSRKGLANTLLAQARQTIERGDIDAARKLARAAQELNIVYGLFEDRPELILGEIEQRESSRKSKEPVRKRQNKQKALQLLQQAREKIKDGDFRAARKLAHAAQELNVVYDVFDDRPDLVLADIERAER